MVRLSKQTRKRAVSFKRPSKPAKKTGPLKQTIAFKEHQNALSGDFGAKCFIAKIK